ncbi:hypothetical protein BN1723_018462, partial [Verticillium longisporum]
LGLTDGLGRLVEGIAGDVGDLANTLDGARVPGPRSTLANGAGRRLDNGRCRLADGARGALNFPYATIDPEEARVIVPDARYDWLCEKYNPKSRVPANLTVYDIAGLTRGASTGAGLGNAFLSHIRAVDAIFQVVRSFDDAEIIHVEGDVNPTRDLDIISEELRLKDIEFVEKALEAQKKKTRSGGQSLEMKKMIAEQDTIQKIIDWLKDGKDVRKGNW